jgi:2-oxoglutarate ferredoxin oxidoreductase subunit alpha
MNSEDVAAPGNGSSSKRLEEVERVAIRFTGDSGDGMQLTGTKFTETTALAGNDLSTFPDFPAEIRAPAGTLAGVSGFQVHFSSQNIHTPADQPDLLIAFNPAALRANVEDVRPAGMVIVNTDAFNNKALTRAGYTEDPLPALRERFNIVEIPISTLNREALQGLSLGKSDIDRSKNFFALGVLYWLYNRAMEPTERWLATKFKGEVLEANLRTLRAGHAFGETTELFPVSYTIGKAKLEAGTYRNITGNVALAWGVIAAGVQLDRPIFFGAYPITPASDVLHEVAKHRNFGVKTFQAEDEIAAVGSAIGASFSGALGITASSGPGIVLKQEALGLAVMVELPLIVIDVQRAGPSTGSPTKNEQGDLHLAMYGRHGASPIPVLAAATPSDCFATMIEAAQIAVRYMTPVFVMSDSYLANSAEPWRLPDISTLPRMKVELAKANDENYQPYKRNEETLAREWAIPGTPGLEHRIGGLTKADGTGNVVYDPDNHAKMIALRAEKVARIALDLPPQEVDGPDDADLLVVGWGGTKGAITAAIEVARAAGHKVAVTHLRHLNPLPQDLGDILRRYPKVIVPELNTGQLAMILRGEYLVDAISYQKVNGMPFKIAELVDAIEKTLRGETL